MASQVLSGTTNFSHVNSTGQNVRVVINYMSASSNGTISLSWDVGVSASATTLAIGRNLAFSSTQSSANNMFGDLPAALPTELMLASGKTFSAICGTYNIVVIPEAG